ncbi:hypothetical protein OS493_009977 [Desmophyllum pertusum]|uniref:Protein kinase domain-containing protein n=1 Tax=Desmophyllum pertusum TaxID=174260 RepID=A0A9W9YEB2_9CNID|nr:hypothetical protein OS493_009977 [Desmophyllum pertusum]
MACSDNTVLAPEGCLPCQNGTFISFSGWSECEPLLNCSNIALHVHPRKRIFGSFTKQIWLADWKSHQVIYMNCSRPFLKTKCLRGMTRLEQLQGPYVTRLIGRCYDKLEMVTMFYKHGSLRRLDRLLKQPELSHYNNIRTRLQLSVDYVKIMSYLHNSPMGVLVMCDTVSLRKLLSQFLITDDFRLVVNDLDMALEVTQEKGILCHKSEKELRPFEAPEQRWPIFRKDLTHDEKVDIWKFPAVVEKLLDGVNGSSFAKSELRKMMETCRATNPEQRPTSNEVLQELLRIQQLITE